MLFEPRDVAYGNLLAAEDMRFFTLVIILRSIVLVGGVLSIVWIFARTAWVKIRDLDVFYIVFLHVSSAQLWDIVIKYRRWLKWWKACMWFDVALNKSIPPWRVTGRNRIQFPGEKIHPLLDQVRSARKDQCYRSFNRCLRLYPCRSTFIYSGRRTVNIFGANFFRKDLLAFREGCESVCPPECIYMRVARAWRLLTKGIIGRRTYNICPRGTGTVHWI